MHAGMHACMDARKPPFTFPPPAHRTCPPHAKSGAGRPSSWPEACTLRPVCMAHDNEEATDEYATHRYAAHRHATHVELKIETELH